MQALQESEGLCKAEQSVIDIPYTLFKRLVKFGIIDTTGVRSHNEGESNYAEHLQTAWSIACEYPHLTFWDIDIIKRILREKDTDPREMEYRKIIHDAQERLRQLELEKNNQ